MKNIKVGQNVWYIDQDDCLARPAKVMKLKEDYAILRDGVCGWEDVVYYNVIYATEEECIKAIKTICDVRVNEYKEKMPDINACLAFAYKYHVSRTEEYTDWDARRAYKERVFELTGVKLED